MTQNQIKYQELQETRRSNLAKERETVRHNVASLGETQRHNLATESVDSATLQENIRHNYASESNELFRNQETQRHNIVSEAETAAHNRASEAVAEGSLAESIRHNQMSENLSQSSIQLGYAQVGLGYSQLAESSRHNLAAEVEQNRHNIAQESNNILGTYYTHTDTQARTAETERSNVMSENIRRQELFETQKHNRETEARQSLQTLFGGVGSASVGALLK